MPLSNLKGKYFTDIELRDIFANLSENEDDLD